MSPSVIDPRFIGEYTGFAPTDESPITLGELKISITPEKMVIQQATGIRVIVEEILTGQLHPMNQSEVQSDFIVDSTSPRSISGYRLANGLRLLFLDEPKGDEDVALIIRGNELADMLAPTFLYNTKQIEEGVLARAIAVLEDEYGPNCFPTIAAGGRLR